MERLGDYYREEKKMHAEAKKYYLMAMEKSNSPESASLLIHYYYVSKKMRTKCYKIYEKRAYMNSYLFESIGKYCGPNVKYMNTY